MEIILKQKRFKNQIKKYFEYFFNEKIIIGIKFVQEFNTFTFLWAYLIQ